MTKPLRHTIRRIHRLHQISDTSFDRHVDAGFLPVRGILSLRSDYSRAASNPLFSLFFSPPRWFGPRWRAVLLICVRRGFESRNRGNRDYLILGDGKKVKERKKETRDFSLFTFVSFSRFEERTFRCLANSSKFLEEERNWKDRKYHRAGNILTENKKKGREQSNLQRCVDGGQTVGGKAIVNEFDGRWEVINDDTDVISRN